MWWLAKSSGACCDKMAVATCRLASWLAASAPSQRTLLRPSRSGTRRARLPLTSGTTPSQHMCICLLLWGSELPDVHAPHGQGQLVAVRQWQQA